MAQPSIKTLIFQLDPMLMPASSEFVALCQAQVTLLTKVLGAALSVVYLTEELVEGDETKLIPVVAYPESTAIWEKNDTLTLLPDELQRVKTIPRLPSAVSEDPSMLLELALDNQETSEQQQGESSSLMQQRQVVFPLMHEGMVMGLLVTSRGDRAWNEQEKTQIEGIAHTMAIGCILDRRSQWLERKFTQQQRLQAQQNDLLHNLLHQLRNPLTALRTFGKLLLKRLQPEDKNREIASNIVRESDRIQDLLEQFDRVLELTASVGEVERDDVFANSLTISPVELKVEEEQEKTANKASGNKPLLLLPESGLMQIAMESCSVTEVLKPLLVSARAIAQERNLELKGEIPDALPLVKGNTKALTEVFSNIFDNALKYTPEGGSIYIEVKQKNTSSQDKLLGISVSDTGSGLPTQDLEHLFERGFRGVQEKTEIPGTGLGLAIARNLVKQMQGEIEVFSPAQHSEAGRRGATFIVWLQEV